MTFASRETSLATGQPVRLYEFQRGIFRWRYTDADRAMEYLTQTYEPIAISDDGVRQSGEAGSDDLAITVPHDLPVARLFRGAPPASEIGIVVRDTHFGETDTLIRYNGSVIGARFPAPGQAVLTCQSLSASMRRSGLRLAWERGCTHSLYDHNCRVVRETFAVPTTIATLTGTTITSAAFDAFSDGYFAGGYVEWSIGSGETDRRGIEAHVGGVLTLLGGTDGLQVAMGVTAYPGCPRTIDICNSRFNNVVNYGGIPHLPGKSPFDGTPVF